MPTNMTHSAKGTTGKRNTPEFKEFTVEVGIYTVDKIGFDLIVEDKGIKYLVDLVNKTLDTNEVNAERARLTAEKEEDNKKKYKESVVYATLWQEVMNASTEEEKMAILAKAQANQ